MTGKKVLVVFHSSSGNTKRVAAAIAEALSADIEQIQPTRPFRVDIKGKGLRNFMNMGRAALGGLSGRAASIRETHSRLRANQQMFLPPLAQRTSAEPSA